MNDSPIGAEMSTSTRFNFRKLKAITRNTHAKSPLASDRARLARQGFMRVEVNVLKEDAGLLRVVAAALAGPARRAEARALIHQRLAPPPEVSLKALLASAPLDGIDLERDRDRDVELRPG